MLEIRRAASSDAVGIARVFLESAEHHAALEPERYFVPAYDAIVERYTKGEQHPARPEGETLTLVATLDGEVVGFLDARLERPFDAMHRPLLCCYIAEIAVSASFRSQGAGEKLMRAAEDWGQQQGAEFAMLEYNAANTRAGEFYGKRLGYRVASMTAVKLLT